MAAAGEQAFSSPSRVCSENRLRWDLSPELIQKMSDDFISKTKEMLDAIGSLDLDKVTVSNTLKALDDVSMEYILLWKVLTLNQMVYPNKKVRIASISARKKISEFYVNHRSKIMGEDIFPRIVALSTKVNIDSLTSQDKKYLKIQLSIGNFNHRHKDRQEEIKNITKQLSQLEGCEEQSSAMLKKLAKLLARKGALCGFKTHADYVLKGTMANSAKKVSIFLNELTYKLKPLVDKEKAILLRLKKDHCQKRRLPFNSKLDEKDLAINPDFLITQVINGNYGVAHDQLKEYFPLEVVTQGLLEIYQELLGLSFSLVDGAPVWHSDVALYCVTDQASRQMVGQLYLDLLVREGKYLRGADGLCFGLQAGCLLSDGSRQFPVAAIVTNFSKHKSTPCLLHHLDVLAYVHELGHAMHHLCAQVDYAQFNFSQMEIDFIEAPAQVFENWVWEKEFLQRVSKHYKTGAPIPDDLLDKLIKSRLVRVGMKYMRMIINAKVDHALHTQAGLDPGKEYARLKKEFLGVHASQSTNISDMPFEPLDRFPAKHYRYLWSEVLATDMFYSRFKREGIMNSKVGLDYRECILKPGGSKNAEEMLKNFLGRAPNQEAFLRSKGLTALETRKRKLKESQMKKRKRN